MKSFMRLRLITFLQVLVASNSQTCENGFTEVESECYIETEKQYRYFEDAVEACAQMWVI